MSKAFEDFKKRREITVVAENTKMAVVGILVLSVGIFTFIGKENVRPIIWYWVGFMALLVIFCAIQDILNSRKIKKLGL